MDPDRNKEVYFAWGMGPATNSQAEWYALYMGLEIILSLNIQKVLIVGDWFLIISQARKGIQKEGYATGRIQQRIIEDLKLIKEASFLHVNVQRTQ